VLPRFLLENQERGAALTARPFRYPSGFLEPGHPEGEGGDKPAMLAVPQALDTAIEHHQAGRLQQADQIYREILQADPHQIDALHLLGVIAHQRGRNDEAIDYISRALALDAGQAIIHNSLAAAYQALGKFPEAVASYQQAVRLQPDYAEAHNNLGTALKEQGRLEEAVASCQQALRLKPAYAAAHSGLGNALLEQGRLEEAAASFRQALRLRPDFTEALHNLGSTLKNQGQLAEAVACFQRAVQIKPDLAKAHSNLLCARQYCPGVSLRELAEAHAAYDRQLAAPLRSTWKQHGNNTDPERRLRLGFLSPDLNRHPVGYFLVRCLENLDREQGEALCYRNSPSGGDDLTARIRAATTAWRNVFYWSDEQLADQIRADRIDILFDLAGHTARNRLLVFARKPAPIQVTWAGYVGTTGLEAMDYILADRYQVPPEAEPYYCERVLRLPEGYVTYDPPAYAPPVSPLPALRKGHVTFGSFNNPVKIGPQVVEVWARVLRQLPQARLVLKYKGMDYPVLAGGLAEKFAGHGIGAGRVEFLGLSPHADLLDHYTHIDMALDPFPYNGGLTTLEALWMGVPVLTCPGETFAGRHSLTHLSNLGLTQTIARDLDAYIALAVSLAADLAGLAALRAGLRERMASSALCDGRRFAANLMQLLRGVWREWCRRQPAQGPTLATG
jgi:predicted O-linked N-acetylglucosamine transferase (SPINDLY family)